MKYWHDVVIAVAISALVVAAVLVATKARARDTSGQYAQVTPEMRKWFRERQNKMDEFCCDIGDGQDVLDTEWRRTADGYQVFLNVDRQWHDVPGRAIVETENKWGAALVWLYKGGDGVTYIRCFLPGAGA